MAKAVNPLIARVSETRWNAAADKGLLVLENELKKGVRQVLGLKK